MKQQCNYFALGFKNCFLKIQPRSQAHTCLFSENFLISYSRDLSPLSKQRFSIWPFLTTCNYCKLGFKVHENAWQILFYSVSFGVYNTIVNEVEYLQIECIIIYYML